MSLWSRILWRRGDDRAALRPLWSRVVALAREPRWYADCGVADTIAGRFDAVVLVLALVLLRMERSAALHAPSTRLTELFVEDMDGQLRQGGVGDLVVGKHVGRLMGALGGRLGTLRQALPHGRAALMPVIARNLSLAGATDPGAATDFALAIAARLDATADDRLLSGELAA